jgi:hypothetical protein
MTDQTNPPEKSKRVLILNDTQIDGVFYKCRTVLDVPTGKAAELVAASVADDNKAAWEQAVKADKAKPQKHVPVATSAASDDD